MHSQELDNSYTPIHGLRGIGIPTEENAEVFAGSLERQCYPNYLNTDVDHIGHIHHMVRYILYNSDDEDIPPASPEEVRGVDKNFQPKKLSGAVGIPIRVLKDLPRKVIGIATNVFNVMLRFLSPLADVVVIHKPGQPTTRPKNYWPISLLSGLGKTAKHILLRRLTDQVKDRRIISDAQL